MKRRQRSRPGASRPCALAAASACASPANARGVPRKALRVNWSSTRMLRERAARASLPRRRARRAAPARSSRRSARGSRRRTRRPCEPDLALRCRTRRCPARRTRSRARPAAPHRRRIVRRSCGSPAAPDAISTERSPSDDPDRPSCRLTCSCMLRLASSASSRLCSARTRQASMLPARAIRPPRPAHQIGAALAKAQHADPVGAAARLGEAPLLGLADLDPVDDAARSGPSARARARRDPTCPWRTRARRRRRRPGRCSANASSRTIIRSSVSEGWRASVSAWSA